MTPDILAEVAKTIGPSAAILLYMWVNRAPSPKEKADDPAKEIVALLRKLETNIEIILDRMER